MHRLLTLSLIVLSALTATGNVWGADETTAASGADAITPQTSNMESWQQDDNSRNNWTWFGMGYESRRSFSEMNGPAATGSPGGGKAPGAGGHGGRR